MDKCDVYFSWAMVPAKLLIIMKIAKPQWKSCIVTSHSPFPSTVQQQRVVDPVKKAQATAQCRTEGI
jgi:hypothetical protein